MNILITGGTGFLGSHIIKALLESGNHVILLKRSTSSHKKLDTCIDHDGLKSYDIDTIDISAIFRENTIDSIIHSATSYRRKGESLTSMLEVNLMLPMKLMEIAIENNIQHFYNIDTFYKLGVEYPEDLDSYVLSKKQFLEYAQLISQKYNKIHFTNLIAYHMFGEGDDITKFIPFLISSLASKKEQELTAGEQIRDFVYVKDVANIISKLISISPVNYYSQYELGKGKGQTLRSFIENIHDTLGSQTKLLFGALPYRKSESMNEIANTRALEEVIGKIHYTEDTVSIGNTIKYFTKN